MFSIFALTDFLICVSNRAVLQRLYINSDLLKNALLLFILLLTTRKKGNPKKCQCILNKAKYKNPNQTAKVTSEKKKIMRQSERFT